MKLFDKIILGNSYFAPVNGDVVYINTSSEIESLKNKTKIEDEFYNLVYFKNKIWATSKLNGKSQVYSYPEMVKVYEFDILLEPRLDLFKPDNLGLVFCLCSDISGKFWAKVDTKNYEILEKYPINYGSQGFRKILDTSSFISRKSSAIACYELQDGKERWTMDISIKGSYTEMRGGKELGEVTKIMTYGHILVVQITGIFLLGINSQTGQILWERHFDSGLFFTCCQEGNRIHAFSYGTYHEIDIESGEILRQKSLELELQARDCSPASHTAPAVNEKYIAIAPGFRPKALLIDRERLEIVQELDLKGSYVNNSEILQFHDNRLYILDAHNTLHIFEDE